MANELSTRCHSFLLSAEENGCRPCQCDATYGPPEAWHVGSVTLINDTDETWPKAL